MPFEHKKASLALAFNSLDEPTLFFVVRQASVMSDQRNQCILLAVGQLTEALQKLTFMQRKLRAVQTQAWLVAQSAFLKQALLDARDDFRVHAAVMLFGDVSNTFAHTFRKANDELVSCAT
jgi:hypothetical protein